MVMGKTASDDSPRVVCKVGGRIINKHVLCGWEGNQVMCKVGWESYCKIGTQLHMAKRPGSYGIDSL